MKTATRSRAGPRRGLALLATALLLTAAIATPALGEAEDLGEPELLSSPDNTCDKAFPDLTKIDQESGTFTTAEGVLLEWGGYGTSAENAVHYTVPEGYTLDLCVKGGEGAETPAYYEGLTGTGSVTTLYERDVSHISYRVNELPPPPTGSATVVKDWVGDEFDDTDIEVTFTGHIDDGTPFELLPNQSTDLDIGQTLTITDEAVTGMPDGCAYVSDLGDGASFTTTEEQLHGTITITNDVTCEDEEPELIPVGLYKVWLDADGEPILEETPDADFTLTLSVGDDVMASVDQDADPPWAWVDLEPGTTYTVAETDLADGWETVTCPEFDEEAGAGDHSGVGTFELTEGGRHYVCNMEIPVEVLPVVIPPEDEEEPTVEPPVEEKEIDETKGDEEPEVEVLAEVQERTLPRTGADTAALAMLAAGMLMLGAATLAGTRPAPARRRRQ